MTTADILSAKRLTTITDSLIISDPLLSKFIAILKGDTILVDDTLRVITVFRRSMENKLTIDDILSAKRLTTITDSLIINDLLLSKFIAILKGDSILVDDVLRAVIVFRRFVDNQMTTSDLLEAKAIKRMSDSLVISQLLPVKFIAIL